MKTPPHDENLQVSAVRQHFLNQLHHQLTGRRILISIAATLGLIFALPVMVLALQTGLALAAAGALGLAGVFAWKRVPLWITKHENAINEATQQEMNRHLAALKTEARANPIEQAEQEYLCRSAQYQAFKTAMAQIGGKVASLHTRLQQTQKNKPNLDLGAEIAAYQKMQAFYDNRINSLQTAHQKLVEFHEKIEEARIRWEFQLAANAALQAMDCNDKNAKINEILSAVAFDAVQQEFDTVFVNLALDAAEMNNKTTLEFGPQMQIDISTIRIPGVANEQG